MQLQEGMEQFRAELKDRQGALRQELDARLACIRHFHGKKDLRAEEFVQLLGTFPADLDRLAESAEIDNMPFYEMKKLTEKCPQEVGRAFAGLFDEQEDLWRRMVAFRAEITALLAAQPEYDAEDPKYYLSDTAISIYLWLYRPQQYEIYRFWEARVVWDALKPGQQGTIRPGAERDNLAHSRALLEEVLATVCRDAALGALTEAECGGVEGANRVLAALAVKWIGRAVTERESSVDQMAAFFDGLSAREWMKLLEDHHVVTPDSWKLLHILKQVKEWHEWGELRGSSAKYDPEGKMDFFRISGQLVKRIICKVGYPYRTDARKSGRGRNTRWPAVYRLKEDPAGAGGELWALKPALVEALDAMYTKEEFLEDVYLSEEGYDSLRQMLLRKKNIILQGAPGVGKTFAARRLAYSLIGMKDEERIQFVQFHPSYTYEDFVMGYKPDGQGFQLKPGMFYQFCQKAGEHPDQDWFFIVDEINRGEISKIFGELLMLIEKDYRGTKTTLAYTGEAFSVPENLYLIGMMNTADRSLATMDYALRRRFGFFEIAPGFDTDGFRAYQKTLQNPVFDRLIEKVKRLNQAIAEDRYLGEEFCIGHSYFGGCRPKECTAEWMRSIVEYDIVPMLNEYWVDDDRAKAVAWKEELEGVLRGADGDR